MRLTTLFESGPKFKSLEDNTVPLSDEERKKVMKAKATFTFSHIKKPTAAVKKAVIRGKTYYYSATHRCFQSATTLEKAIEDFHKIVKPSS